MAEPRRRVGRAALGRIADTQREAGVDEDPGLAVASATDVLFDLFVVVTGIVGDTEVVVALQPHTTIRRLTAGISQPCRASLLTAG